MLSFVWLFATQWTVAYQAPLSTRFSKNPGVECHFLLQGTFPSRGSKPHLLCLLHWQGGSLPLNYLGSPILAVVAAVIMINYDKCCSTSLCSGYRKMLGFPTLWGRNCLYYHNAKVIKMSIQMIQDWPILVPTASKETSVVIPAARTHGCSLGRPGQVLSLWQTLLVFIFETNLLVKN